MNKYILILYIVSILFSCTPNYNNIKENKDVHTIELESSGNLRDLNTTLFCKEAVALLLEDNERSKIGSIDKIEIIDNEIYIMDQMVARSLFVFDLKGKFIRRVGQVGKGPGEYLNIIDFTVDAKENSIFVLTYGKILKYSKNSKFIKSIDVDNNVIGIFWSNKSLFLKHRAIFNEDINLITAINENGKQISAWLSNKVYAKGFFGNISFSRKPFTGDDQQVKFFTHFNNTVYCAQNGEVSPYLEVVANNSFDKSDVKKYSELKSKLGFGDDTEINELFKDKFWGIWNYYEVGKLMFIESRNNRFSVRIMYNSETQKSFYSYNIRNDEYGTRNLMILNCTDKDIIGKVENPYDRMAILQKIKEGIIRTENDINEFEHNDNPIIMFYRIKDVYL
jgi:hypothetical protein